MCTALNMPLPVAMQKLLRSAGIAPSNADEQLEERARWQMSAYLDVACKRLRHRLPEQEAWHSRRDEQVAVMLRQLHALDTGSCHI